MPMKSKDVIRQELHDKFAAALTGENPDQITDALADFAVSLQADVIADAHAYQQTQDSAILDKRGVRQLTSAEKKFYMNNMKWNNNMNSNMSNCCGNNSTNNMNNGCCNMRNDSSSEA